MVLREAEGGGNEWKSARLIGLGPPPIPHPFGPSPFASGASPLYVT